jgi:NADPH:quinone reductase-like Zn-dependent oxidoreductase
MEVKVFVFGMLGGNDITIGGGDLFRGVRLTGWNLYHAIASAERRKEFTNGVSKLLEAKIIVPLTGKTYDLGDFQLAIKKTLEVSGGGKVLLSS